jgi:hypothetical protein
MYQPLLFTPSLRTLQSRTQSRLPCASDDITVQYSGDTGAKDHRDGVQVSFESAMAGTLRVQILVLHILSILPCFSVKFRRQNAVMSCCMINTQISFLFRVLVPFGSH